MSKLMLSFVFATIAAIAVFGAVTPPKPLKDMTPEERQAWSRQREEERYRKTGGEVIKPNSRKGAVAFISQQDSLPDSEFEKILQLLRQDNNITYKFVKGQKGQAPDEALVAAKATFAIIVIDDPNEPSMLVANDDRWAKLNVAKFNKNISQGKLSHIPYYARCRKGILRAYSVLLGGARSQFPGNILAVTNLEDLDAVGEFVPGDVQMVIRQTFKDYEITAETKAMYIRACKEGWAPAPTNDIQKAIYERVRSEKERGPVNGLKITPPNQTK